MERERERWIDEMDSIPGIGFKNKMKRIEPPTR